MDETIAESIRGGDGTFLTIYNNSPNNNDEKEVENDAIRKPLFFSSCCYILMSLVCFGWVIRLLIFSKSISTNIFMKKVILR